MSNLITSGLTSYCPDCSTCLEGRIERCTECARQRPEAGWPSLYECPYPFLGRIVEGRYLIDRFLGSGATGLVYRARSLRFSRQFAIKIVDTGRFADPTRQQQMAEHFQREVDAISRVKSPHVVGVYEALELSDGVLGLVLDYIDGLTLDAFIEEHGRLKLSDAVSIAQQIATGLHEAHRNGIIHRDLKPQNVMVEALPAAGLFARILDFGIAQVIGSSHQTYGFRGTPLYASPEQCLGHTELDVRSDIYSLGCLLYQLLTGKPPFSFTNALRVMDAHVEAPRPKLSDVGGESFPLELEHLVGHMLARLRVDRPADLHLVYQDLTAFLKGRPLQHFGHRPTYRNTPPARTFDHTDTPPLEEFVSLAERTSNELASDPTFSEVVSIPLWKTDQGVEMAQRLELSAPFAARENFTLTAAGIDRRGMASLFADQSPNLHFLELRARGFQNVIKPRALISSVELDLMQGILLAADIEANLHEFDPSGNLRQSTHLEEPALVLELVEASQQLYFGTEKGKLFLVDLRTRAQRELVRMPHAISALHTHKNAPLLVGLYDGSVAKVEKEGPVRWHLPIAPDAITAVGHLDAETYFALDSRGTLHLGERNSGARLSSHEIGPGLRTLRKLSDGRLLGLSLFQELAHLWELSIPR